MDILTLDIKGVLLALLIALVMLYLGGPLLGSFYIFVMIYFLVLSAMVTHLGTKYKKKIRQYQKTRGIKNVVANGLGPLIFVLLAHFQAFGLSGTVYTFTFMASVAAVTADKFSSEIGVLDGEPTSIVTFKKVEKGTSGGVTLFGIGMGVFGAFLIAIVSALVFFFFNPTLFNCSVGGCSSVPPLLLLLIASAIVGGFVGTISDSYLGYFEEKGIGNKYTSNFICSVAGALVGFALVVLI